MPDGQKINKEYSGSYNVNPNPTATTQYSITCTDDVTPDVTCQNSATNPPECNFNYCSGSLAMTTAYGDCFHDSVINNCAATIFYTPLEAYLNGTIDFGTFYSSGSGYGPANGYIKWELYPGPYIEGNDCSPKVDKNVSRSSCAASGGVFTQTSSEVTATISCSTVISSKNICDGADGCTWVNDSGLSNPLICAGTYDNAYSSSGTWVAGKDCSTSKGNCITDANNDGCYFADHACVGTYNNTYSSSGTLLSGARCSPLTETDCGNHGGCTWY